MQRVDAARLRDLRIVIDSRDERFKNLAYCRVLAKRESQANVDREFAGWVRTGLGRNSGEGMPGTADFAGRILFAALFLCSIKDKSRVHLAFTDQGCDHGDFMFCMLRAGMDSAYGYEMASGSKIVSEQWDKTKGWECSVCMAHVRAMHCGTLRYITL